MSTDYVYKSDQLLTLEEVKVIRNKVKKHYRKYFDTYKKDEGLAFLYRKDFVPNIKDFSMLNIKGCSFHGTLSNEKKEWDVFKGILLNSKKIHSLKGNISFDIYMRDGLGQNTDDFQDLVCLSNGVEYEYMMYTPANHTAKEFKYKDYGKEIFKEIISVGKLPLEIVEEDEYYYFKNTLTNEKNFCKYNRVEKNESPKYLKVDISHLSNDEKLDSLRNITECINKGISYFRWYVGPNQRIGNKIFPPKNVVKLFKEVASQKIPAREVEIWIWYEVKKLDNLGCFQKLFKLKDNAQSNLGQFHDYPRKSIEFDTSCECDVGIDDEDDYDDDIDCYGEIEMHISEEGFKLDVYLSYPSMIKDFEKVTGLKFEQEEC